MHKWIRPMLPGALILAGAGWLSSCGHQQSFEAQYQTAQANAASGAGAVYDNALGAALRVPGSPLALRECVINNPGQNSVHGYFEIKSSTDYAVVLQPKGGLADCIASHLEHHTVPEPPQSPYLNPFEFSVTP